MLALRHRSHAILATLIFSTVIVTGCGASQTESLGLSETAEVDDLRLDLIEQAIASAQNQPTMNEKIRAASDAFLARPYAGGPLGEGDDKPRYRGDAFDCTTLVETVMASAEVSSFEEFKSYIDAVRYKNGEVSFVTRNHMPEADWSRNNIRSGLLADVTAAVAKQSGLGSLIATPRIDKQAWFKAFHGLDVPVSAEVVEVPYIAIRSIFIEGPALDAMAKQYQAKEAEFITRLKATKEVSAKNAIRAEWHDYLASLDLSSIRNDALLQSTDLAGTVVNLVTPDWQISKDGLSTDLGIGHQGLVIERDGRLYVRDASSTFNQVSETPFENYFLAKLNNKLQRGINLLKIQSVRLEELATAP